MQRFVTTRLRHAAIVSATVGTAFAVAFSASASAARSASRVGSAAAACGTVPTIAFHDQSGVIAKLGAAYTSQFNGYAQPIYKSDYAKFKPKGKPPYTVGLAITAPDTPSQAVLNPALAAGVKEIPGVKKVILLTTGPTALTTQIQQVHELIQQKVSFIVAQPLVSQSFVSLANAAKAAHIPFISIYNAVPTAASINIAPNSVNDGLVSGAKLAKAIGGKGNVVGVQGIPGVGVNTEEMEGWSAAFKACPGISFDNSVIGEFQPPVAKQAMLSYLSSHPQPIAGVVETADMTIGIIQAFQQAGRPIPKIVDVGPSDGEFVFFNANKGDLVTSLTIPPTGVVNAVKFTISKLIKGQGPKISEISALSPVYNVSSLSQYIPAGATESDEAAPNITWLPGSYLAKLFN
jgi:ribose transport system substrate-binding protein